VFSSINRLHYADCRRNDRRDPFLLGRRRSHPIQVSRIINIKRKSFIHLHKLKILDLHNNPIKNVEFSTINRRTIKLALLKVSDAKICCLFEVVEICAVKPKVSRTGRCSHGDSNPIMSVTLIIAGTVAILTNLMALVIRVHLPKTFYSLNAISMIASDSTMASYLTLLSSLKARQMPVTYFNWRSLAVCKGVAVYVAMFIIISRCSMLIMTKDTYQILVKPLQTKTQKRSRKSRSTDIAYAWIMSLLTAMVLFYWGDRAIITNDLCQMFFYRSEESSKILYGGMILHCVINIFFSLLCFSGNIYICCKLSKPDDSDLLVANSKSQVFHVCTKIIMASIIDFVITFVNAMTSFISLVNPTINYANLEVRILFLQKFTCILNPTFHTLATSCVK